MIRLRLASCFLVTLSSVVGISNTFIYVLVLFLAILDVMVEFLQTDIVQTFIREREKTKRRQLTEPKRRQKK